MRYSAFRRIGIGLGADAWVRAPAFVRVRAPALIRIGALALSLASAVTGCSLVGLGGPPEPPLPPLSQRIDALLGEPPFEGVHWGLLVTDLGSGRLLYERSSVQRFIPASNAKIGVAVAALGLLGPDFRWRTELWAAVPPGGGVLEGDLILAGTGDPTLGLPFFDPPESALRALADSLRAAGVERVTGSLVLDASAWDSVSVPGSWMVEDLAPAIGATGGAFAFSRGELEVTVLGGARPGDSARVTWTPLGDTPLVRAAVVTVDEDGQTELTAGFLPESRVWEFGGRIAAGDSTSFMISMRDPVRVGLDALRSALEATGIRIEGGTTIVWNTDERAIDYGCASGVIAGCPPVVRIAGMVSPPLMDVVGAILGPSQNWMAEQLIRTLGSRAGAMGSWAEGSRAATDYLVRVVGVDPQDIRIEDGSGLSMKNLTTPRALVAILDHARSRSWFQDFRDGLPSPGRMETTLDTRLGGLDKRVYAKTGTLTHVNSLTGYLVGRDGETLAFAILSNGSNLPSSVVMARIDDVVWEIARELDGDDR